MQPGMSNQRIISTTARGRVATIHGGTASLQIEANVPSSQAKVCINVTSGTASARVKAQEPSKSSVVTERMNV